ncbi:glutathione S-transferase family protein [Bauldia litoralis]|uniref:glutathione S-transferase family protein n=1 Tax=Bauldia litoralis TaxID=665467 RepID=UPI000ABCCCDE|nr:glutathione S-transferase family protein [Bauldia litoralis]
MSVLYHHPLSAPCRYVRLILAEYGEAVELVEMPPWVRSEDLLALNPAGTVPVFVDETDGPIAGATVIAEYLAETRGSRVGESTLMPITPADRAEVRRLVSWFLDKLDDEVVGYLITEKVLKRLAPASNGGGSPDAAAIRAARSNIRYHLRYIGYLVTRRNCLAGRELTFADLAAAAELSCADYLGEVPWEEDATAKEWYARVKSRPSFREILADKVRGSLPATHYADLDF